MEFRCLQIAVIISVFKACLSSKNNTTIYVCIGEDVTLSCPPAGFNKTISWFRRNVSKNTITTLYGGTKGKDTNLPLNNAVDVNKEKGEFNLTIKNLTKADNGTYQCLHDKHLTSWLFRLVIKDRPIANKSNEPITTVIPQCSGGFLTSDKIIYGVVVVLLVLVLIIVSLICHAYIRIQYKQKDVPVPQTDTVRHSPVHIEMQEVSYDGEDVHEESRNLHLLSEILQDLQNTTSDDKHSDLSKTSPSQSSFSLSNRSQNLNEEDYLHPYHGFVQSKIDVHEYATVDAQESTDCEGIPGTSKEQIVIYENLKSSN
ncbi:uncharacterized protein [Mytilus edulis]|uniref:uncharacterized protein n=1 Tax=Mytilus edulis TaxID=6550 RepID=UPI0039EDF982